MKTKDKKSGKMMVVILSSFFVALIFEQDNGDIMVYRVHNLNLDKSKIYLSENDSERNLIIFVI